MVVRRPSCSEAAILGTSDGLLQYLDRERCSSLSWKVNGKFSPQNTQQRWYGDEEGKTKCVISNTFVGGSVNTARAYTATLDVR